MVICGRCWLVVTSYISYFFVLFCFFYWYQWLHRKGRLIALFAGLNLSRNQLHNIYRQRKHHIMGRRCIFVSSFNEFTYIIAQKKLFCYKIEWRSSRLVRRFCERSTDVLRPLEYIKAYYTTFLKISDFQINWNLLLDCATKSIFPCSLSALQWLPKDQSKHRRKDVFPPPLDESIRSSQQHVMNISGTLRYNAQHFHGW